MDAAFAPGNHHRIHDDGAHDDDGHEEDGHEDADHHQHGLEQITAVFIGMEQPTLVPRLQRQVNYPEEGLSAIILGRPTLGSGRCR